MTNKRQLKKKADIIYRDYVNFDGMRLPIQNSPLYGSYLNILSRTNSLCKAMLSHHCKIYALRVDLHINHLVWQEGHLSKFFKNATRQLKEKYSCNKIGYLWVREANQDGHSHFHYHIVFFINGHRVNRSKGITDILLKVWKKLGHSSIWTCEGHLLTSISNSEFQDAFHHFSYLAKIRSKDFQPPHKQNFNYSRVQIAY